LATDAAFRKIVWSAGGSTIPDNDFTLKLNPVGVVALRTESLTALGQPIDGPAGLPGLFNVRREFDLDADVKRQPADFASLDTFGYAVLSIDPSSTLTVSIDGIPSYLPNLNFSKQPEPEHRVLSFQIRPR
jgi:hypothetical protein